MKKAVKGNRVLRIPDEKVKDYKAMGYTIKEMDGKVIYEPNDAKKEAEQLKAQVSELEDKLAKATAQAGEAMKQVEALTKTKEVLEAKVSELEDKLAKTQKVAPAKTPDAGKQADSGKQATN